MKVLISTEEVKKRAIGGEKKILLGPNSIITPAARDMARELGVIISHNDDSCCVAVQRSSQAKQIVSGNGTTELVNSVSQTMGDLHVSQDLVARIVKEVLVILEDGKLQEPRVEKHKSGIRLIRGDSVIGEPFETGNPRDKVFLKDVLPVEESPNMCAGFINMEKSSFEWELKYDEYDYVIDGVLEIGIDGQTYRGMPGDVFFIPRGTRITFNSPEKTRFFYVTYPANWREQE